MAYDNNAHQNESTLNKKVTWESVIARDDIIGGDIEIHTNEGVFRGPIATITIENGCVHFSNLWTAMMDRQAGSWQKCHNIICFTLTQILPSDIGSGRLAFNMPMFGRTIIYPVGGSKLDPERVANFGLIR